MRIGTSTSSHHRHKSSATGNEGTIMETSVPTGNTNATLHLCQINNESVEWMSQGDYQAAFYHLQDAIRLVSGVLSRPPTSSSTIQEKQENSDSLRQGNLVETRPAYLGVDACERFGIGTRHQLWASNILNLPFFISKFSQLESNAYHDHCFIQSVASVSIFNMGMALFLQANYCTTCRSREGLLDRALFLFRQALQLAEPSSQIYLACCHNIVEIAVHRGDLVGAQKWRRRIQRAADTIGESWGIYQQAVCIYHSGTFIASRAA